MSNDQKSNLDFQYSNNRTNNNQNKQINRNKSQKRPKSKRSHFKKENEKIYNEEEYNNLSYKNRPNLKYSNHQLLKNPINKKIENEYNDFKNKFKTEICHFWEMNGYCKFGENCAFAHGESELKNRKMSFNYKTKPCKQFFENGFCNYGSRCQFSHKREYFNSSDVSYLKCLNEFNNFEKINEKMLKRPRLLTFEIIVHSNDEERKENRMKLYEDFISIKNEMKFSEDSTTSGSLYSEKNNNKRNRFMSV